MIRDPQDAADELAAEQGYADMLAHPETVVDAFDLFVAGAPFDRCDGRRHYAVGAAANGAHVAWDAFTPHHEVGECPNANETVDGAWRAWHPCEPSQRDD
jgi:hypothetical protein